MKKIWCLACFMLLFFITITTGTAIAAEGSMKLLAVTEEAPFEGSIANLLLKVEPGTGRIFIETFPYTKLDTQISIKFANEIACKEFELDCSAYDFFYTIKSGSSIIGGPSAGAAAAALTVSVLKGLELRDDVTLTGTINSGGLIGSVGGLQAKLKVASESGIKRVLIPKGTAITNESNQTVNLTSYGKEVGIRATEVGDLPSALFYLTGVRFEEEKRNISIDEGYRNIMLTLASDLCERSEKLKSDVQKGKSKDLADKDFLENEVAALNLTEKGTAAFKSQAYYSSASYCFGANVKYRYLAILLHNYSSEQLKEKIGSLELDIVNYEASLPAYNTISDLQTYTVVKDRLSEALRFVNLSRGDLMTNTSVSLNNLAYATERFYSADSWAQFFGTGKKKFELGRDNLKATCDSKIAEADERLQYARLFIASPMQNIASGVSQARGLGEAGEYELCLYEAIKAKAEANLVLTLIGTNQDLLSDVVGYKLEAAKKEIIKETERGAFPIVGYSYYEYSNALKDTDPVSALLYSEYSLELSNLDIYFKETGEQNLTVLKLPGKPAGRILLDKSNIAPFVVGVALGAIIMALLLSEKRGKRILLVKRK